MAIDKVHTVVRDRAMESGSCVFFKKSKIRVVPGIIRMRKKFFTYRFQFLYIYEVAIVASNRKGEKPSQNARKY